MRPNYYTVHSPLDAIILNAEQYKWTTVLPNNINDRGAAGRNGVSTLRKEDNLLHYRHQSEAKRIRTIRKGGGEQGRMPMRLGCLQHLIYAYW